MMLDIDAHSVDVECPICCFSGRVTLKEVRTRTPIDTAHRNGPAFAH